MYLSNIAVCIFIIMKVISAYKILSILPSKAKSHSIVYKGLMKELAKRGHEVHVITNFPQDEPIPSYLDINLDTVGPSPEVFNVSQFFRNPWINCVTTQLAVLFLGNMMCNSSLPSKPIQQFIEKKPKYDLIIAEYFNSNCFLSLLATIKAPLIGVIAAELLPFNTDYLTIPDNPAYLPHPYSHLIAPFSFWERTGNTLAYLFTKFFFYLFIVTMTNYNSQKVFGLDAEEFASNVSLFLVNRHNSVQHARPLPPNVIEVAGIHIDKWKRPPMNIEKWINESEAGVIYFSMGSMIKGHTIPEDKRRAFIRAFARLKQRVLWKWENETMPEKPDNVMIQKWMPQFDILCHPNVKAFISHGGLLGIIEAVHCGVPVVSMPQFADGHIHARELEANGGGIVLNFNDVNEESVFNALQTILDPEFNKQTKELSLRFRDRPMSPVDTAIYWIEYVARHKGAHHMRTAAVGMPFYQYHLLDVIAFLATISILMLLVSYYITKTFFNMLFCKKKSKNAKKEKKN